MNPNHESIARKILGILLLIAGIGFLGEQCNLWAFTIFFPGWWTLFLILPAIFSIYERGWKLLNVLLLLAGLYFLLDANGWVFFHFTFKSLLALALIAFGLYFVFRTAKEDEKVWSSDDTLEDGQNVVSHVQFGSRRLHVNGAIYNLRAESIFGSQYIDLSKADIINLNRVRLHSIFGLIRLRLPADANIILTKDCVFADCYADENSQGLFDVEIEAGAVFGKIQIEKEKKAEEIQNTNGKDPRWDEE